MSKNCTLVRFQGLKSTVVLENSFWTLKLPKFLPNNILIVVALKHTQYSISNWLKNVTGHFNYMELFNVFTVFTWKCEQLSQ